jgi:hypothetical protein
VVTNEHQYTATIVFIVLPPAAAWRTTRRSRPSRCARRRPW